MAAPFKFTAEQLSNKYIEYLEYMADKFDVKIDYIKSGERAGELIEIKLPKIKSIQGFCNYCKMDMQTFYDYCNANSDNVDTQLIDIASYIRNELLEYRKSLGLNNIINPNLLMAIDGIKQTIEVDQKALQPVTINILGSDMNLKSLYTDIQETISID